MSAAQNAPGKPASGTPAAAAFATLFLLLPAGLVLGAAFLLPLARLFGLSGSMPAGVLAPYLELLGDDVYRKVFFNTVFFAIVVTAVTLVLGYPLALALARMRAGWRALFLLAVLMPLWISVLVRTFSWMLLLERNGPINRALIASGLTDTPMSLLFNKTGVLIGMVHVLLPYAVLPIFGAILRIDPALLRASEGLGAPRHVTFRRVLLPLSMRGVATAATFVFLLSLGFFITPALLGGASEITLSMLVENLVNERLAWPLAAAASVILLALTLALLAVAGRFLSPAAVAGVGR
ncbi:ABC transporter permease [Allostella vacuolata]|nr:ABC transporter permease [Stella vacuolata]